MLIYRPEPFTENTGFAPAGHWFPASRARATTLCATQGARLPALPCPGPESKLEKAGERLEGSVYLDAFKGYTRNTCAHIPTFRGEAQQCHVAEKKAAAKNLENLSQHLFHYIAPVAEEKATTPLVTAGSTCRMPFAEASRPGPGSATGRRRVPLTDALLGLTGEI